MEAGFEGKYLLVGGEIGSFGFLELALSGGKKPNVPMCVGTNYFFRAWAKNL